MLLLVGAFVGAPALAAPPAEPQPIMTVDQVRVGMRGYGLTVYHGDTIEPFPVEVMSIVPDSNPKRSVIWVNCYDERMQKYGPVQGMSGSPIYLWDQGDDQKLGVGGRLIGAFAFGYSDTNECMAGVQPIAYMRETGARAALPDADDVDGQQADGASASHERAPRPGTAMAMLSGLRAATTADGSRGSEAWSGRTIEHASLLVSRTPWGRALGADVAGWNTMGGRPGDGRPRAWGMDGAGASPERLLLPIDVGSPEAAAALRPMMAAAGLMPHAGGLAGTNVGAAGRREPGLLSELPSNIVADRVQLEPGSVLAIPLAFGDYVPVASGTVTDVLPDGTVLGFGHAMDGTGDTALPLATGFTHFVVSRNTVSFKRSAAIALQGTIVQDEMAAVAGLPGVAYTTSPARVAVLMPGQPQRDYAYDIVNHPTYTPSIAVLMPIVSLIAVQSPPERNTLHMTGSVAFSNGRTLPIDLLIPFAGPASLAWELSPTLGSLLTNEFTPVELTSMEMTLDVSDKVRLSFIQSVSVSPPIVKPGQDVVVTVVTQPYGGVAETQRFDIAVPHDLPEGEYPLLVSGADSYLNRQLMTDPKWATLDDADELFDAFGMMLDLKRDAVYVSLMRHDAMARGVSVGNLRLPALPSHHAALLRSHATTLTGPGMPGIDRMFPTENVINGEAAVTLRVVQP